MKHFTDLLDRALESPLEIWVRTNDADLLRRRLYAARNDKGKPEYKLLSLRVSPRERNTLWIMKGAVNAGS